MSGLTTTNPQTSSTAPITLPLSRRNEALNYQSDDGNAGARCYPINYEELYNLKGRLLTVVDATFTDQQQRKAMKDIVWQTLQAWMGDIERAAGYEPHPFGVSADEYAPPLAA